MDVINVYLQSVDRRARIMAGVYDNQNSRPRTLLGGNKTGVTNLRAGWNSVPIPPVELQKGERYWLAVLAIGGNIAIRDFSPAGGTSDSVTTRDDIEALQNQFESHRVWPKDGPASIYAAERYNVLVFTLARRGGVTEGVAALRAQADAHEVTFDVTDEPKFTDANLAKYRAVVFLNNAGDVLDGDQQPRSRSTSAAAAASSASTRRSRPSRIGSS